MHDHTIHTMYILLYINYHKLYPRTLGRIRPLFLLSMIFYVYKVLPSTSLHPATLPHACHWDLHRRRMLPPTSVVAVSSAFVRPARAVLHPT